MSYVQDTIRLERSSFQSRSFNYLQQILILHFLSQKPHPPVTMAATRQMSRSPVLLFPMRAIVCHLWLQADEMYRD